MKGLNLAEWAIKHKPVVYFFIFFILLGGLWSYFHLGRSEDPDFTIRQAVVSAAWPGATAEQITEQVTDPLEKKLQDTKGLDYLKSFTHDGKTVIYVNLKDSVKKEDIQTRWHEVRNLVNDEKAALPAGVYGPYVNDRFDDVYGSIYAVTGDGFSYEEKRKSAEMLRRRLAAVEDVQKVELLGVQEQNIYIEMDQNKLASFGMNPSDVFRILQQQSAMMPAGTIHTSSRNVAIRVDGLLGSVEALENIPIHVGERSFHLGDVAKVTQRALDDLVQSLGIGASGEEAYAPRRNRRDPRPIREAEAVEKAPVSAEIHQEPAAPEKELPKPFTEGDLLARLKEAAENDGLLYAEKDLFHFHISMKSSRLVILAGKSGIGKSGLVRLYGRALGLPESQVCFLPVRPSWMDDGDVLGYVDMKNMVYRSADTGLAELLIDAAAHPEKQYIVCFDEMNLARVEHYFAQFISVLEKEDHPMIRLYNPSLAPRLYNSEKYPPEIPVGRNVLFTGTVNVDESTCHFSDKILDRANVITLSQCHFRDLLKLSPQERKVYKEITAEEYDDFRVKEGMGLNDKELELLDALNDAFTKSGMPYGIGFRVAQQMGRYLENIPEEAGISRGEGLDAQLVQRVFTKLRGSADQLSALLSLSDKNTAEGLLPAILVRFKALSDFQESQAVLKRKAGELKLYDYTM